MCVVRFFASRSIDAELGNGFVKFPRGDDRVEQAAASLKIMGFRVLPAWTNSCPTRTPILPKKIHPRGMCTGREAGMTIMSMSGLIAH